ncbi:hypothetical protein P170DRAFT_514222 [Aspergillus steynii IBT 23096]|uniref:Nuclear pore assembly and biogenesis-domain-containing protein n=1 Tax=Aspergillus steynii IBT 23096 TaxID=1392250 RepID=A0A2I2FTF6_9EURO|nr:uncharacterized protein P170DRAFT_514222 [Aspergillus steynii IBT 23096]PLB43923.1 hypothetical protein P170DRAFT_514222 [Aspergillus steynii IBT 23096]
MASLPTSLVSFIQEKLSSMPHSDAVYSHLQPLLDNELVRSSYQKIIASSATAHLEHARSTYLDPCIDHLRASYLDPFIIQPLANLLTNMPDLLSVFVLLLALFISLKVLDYGRRLVMFWVTLALRLVYWGFIIGAGVYVYNAGLEKAAQDLGWFYGLVKGGVESFQNGAQGQGQAQSSASTGGYGGYSYGDSQVRG